MVGKRAVLLLREEWLRMNLYQFLGRDEAIPQNGVVATLVDEQDAHNPHGLFARSVAGKHELGVSEIFIPWNYVEGIVWNDDPDIKKKFGFAADAPNQ